MIADESSDCRVLVVQNGARHDYAIPLALANRDMLAGFYTDACGNQGLGRAAAMLADVFKNSQALKLLKNRRVPAAVLPTTRSFPLATMADQYISTRINRSSTCMLGLSMAFCGMNDANLVYSSLGWSGTFLEEAKRRGLQVVTEFYVRPSLWKVHQEEYRLFPEWQAQPPHAPPPGLTERERLGPCYYSDALVAPTQSVKEDIVREGFFRPEGIHVVPYGIGNAFFEIVNRPKPGNVLFVGSCTLMKGIHYLARTARQISGQTGSPTLEFTAAGDVTDRVRNQPDCAFIRFLGRVPRMEINRLYEDADVLVFPSLSDSFGAVILEAMAAGIPVVCSPYCADLVEHGVSGFVVEPRDTQAFAEAVSTLTSDRGLRDRMAAAAREKARQYSWGHYGSRLANTLRDIRQLRAGRLSAAAI